MENEILSRGQQTFRQGDVTKAVKGVEKAGIPVGRVEITGGKIVVFVGRADDRERETEANEWDDVK
jgi:hypothetical protein